MIKENKLYYYKELDGIRAIAALMVMFYHFFQHLSSDNFVFNVFKKISIIGQTGVSLFFVLSGFLITRILLFNKTSDKYFSTFYIRRALRIFPLYYLFLILFYYVAPLIVDLPKSSFSTQFYYWIYLQNFANTFNWLSYGPPHFWSLAVEEHFYLFWPLIIYYLDNKKVVFTILLLLVVALLTRIYLNSQSLEVFYFTFSRIDELVFGALLALMELNNLFLSKYAKRYFILFIISSIPTILLWVLFSGATNSVVQVIKFPLMAINYFALVAYVISISKQSIVTKILTTRFFTFTGKISYGLYVYHPLCFMILTFKFHTGNYFINFLTAFIATYLIASISYYTFESKFLKFKSRFSS